MGIYVCVGVFCVNVALLNLDCVAKLYYKIIFPRLLVGGVGGVWLT